MVLFLFDCCTTSVKRIVDESDLYDKEFENELMETVEETKVAIRKLQPIVNEWIRLTRNLRMTAVGIPLNGQHLIC